MFKLTEQQIEYITTVYGGTKMIINDIERRLNLLGVVSDEDDYYEIVAAVAAQKETIREKAKGCNTKTEAMRIWVSTDDLIMYALKEKYIDFSCLSLASQEKLKNYR